MDILDSLIEVKLKTPDDFLKVKETLTRIGVASRQTKTLYQSCHILHKRQKYYILHFKEMFLLDGKSSTFNEMDLSRRNTIANILAEWKLLELVDPEKSKEPTINVGQIKILPYKEKSEWTLKAKYNIGSKKKI